MPAPRCFGMSELLTASSLRAQLASSPSSLLPAIAHHLRQGLALTTGSACGETAPNNEHCLAGFVEPNRVGLTAGGRAWQKHAHRSGTTDKASMGWWGVAHGSVSTINAKSLELFHKVRTSNISPVWFLQLTRRMAQVMDNASWRNLHWLPHTVLVYEARVQEGYGMRWSQDRSAFTVATANEESVPVASSHETTSGSGEAQREPLTYMMDSDAPTEKARHLPPEKLVHPTQDCSESGSHEGPNADSTLQPPWIFRGFVEPMMENGHETRWRH
jgi:hypothetical protein